MLSGINLISSPFSRVAETLVHQVHPLDITNRRGVIAMSSFF
jgi:hypothetical protein